MNLDWPALETERLILRPWKPDDFEPYARFSADEESMRYLGRDGRPTDAAETWRTICLFIGHWYLRGYTLWAVEEKATGEFVGRVGPWKPEGWPDLEVDSEVGNAGEAAPVSGQYGVAQRDRGCADHEVVRPDLSVARNAGAQARVNARDRQVERDHPQDPEKGFHEPLPANPPRLGVGTVDALEKFAGRDRRKDEGLPGMPPSKP